MKRARIYVHLNLQDRERLEKILNSKVSTRHDKLKAEVLLLTDISDYGPKLSNLDVIAKLNISSRSLGRIKETYAKNGLIDDLFCFTGLSKQTQSNSNCTVDSNSKAAKQINRRYVELNDNTSDLFLIEHIKCRVTLTQEERKNLEIIISTGKHSIRKLNRAKILLLADEGSKGPSMSDKEIAEKLDISMSTVARVRRLFVTKGSLQDVLNFNHSKAGRLPKINGMVQASLVAQACSQPPKGRCRWTVRLLADRLVELRVVDSISHTAVSTALKKTNLNLGKEKSG